MSKTLQELIDGYLNDTLDEGDVVELEVLLQNDPHAKRELAVQSVLHGQLGLIAEEQQGLGNFGETPVVLPARRHRLIVRLAIVAMVTAASLMLAIVWFVSKDREPTDGPALAYDLQPIAICTVGYTDSDLGQARRVVAGSGVSSSKSTEMTTASGTSVRIARATLYGFSNETLGLLFRGETLVSCIDSGSKYSIEMEDVRATTKNGKFRVVRTENDVAVVEAIQADVQIQRRIRTPRIYWTFDEQESSRAIPLSLGTQVTRVGGLVGLGALLLTDDRGTAAVVESGMTETVGSGVFSMSGAMTIEAIISSTWNGGRDNQDTLFRKEDGPNRILLSLQNNVREYEVPAVPPGPVLSFGIFLQGLGYSELDMPLDGQRGRPTVAEIADGKPHTVVATYDSSTGVKAIAVDGRVRFAHQFPIGHCIQSGGPKPAMIGSWNKREVFGGVIDELAIYDYSLSAEEISSHHKSALTGRRWYPDSSLDAGSWLTTQTVKQGQLVEISLSQMETM